MMSRCGPMRRACSRLLGPVETARLEPDRDTVVDLAFTSLRAASYGSDGERGANWTLDCTMRRLGSSRRIRPVASQAGGLVHRRGD